MHTIQAVNYNDPVFPGYPCTNSEIRSRTETGPQREHIWPLGCSSKACELYLSSGLHTGLSICDATELKLNVFYTVVMLFFY